MPLFCSVAALAVNFVLNRILIYGHFGAPQMGVAGAAVGTLASGIVNLLLLVKGGCCEIPYLDILAPDENIPTKNQCSVNIAFFCENDFQ